MVPDGKTVAVTVMELLQGLHPLLKIVPVAEGSPTNLFQPPLGSILGPAVWLPDGSGLLVAMAKRSPEL